MTRRTKIICTLGPSTDNETVMRALIEEGMNVARFNFSHGPHDEQMGRLKMLRKLRKELGKYVAALLDTKGPEIRLVEFEKGKTELKTGQTFTLTTDDILGTDERVSITYKNLADDVKPGDHILIDDGLVGLEVVEIKPVAKPVNTKVNARDIVCKVLNDGVISNKKGVNVPNVDLTMPFISEKDYGDICFAVENDYDFIAASFVRTAEDVMEIRKILAEKGGEDIKIISKIENMQGVRNIDDIIRVSDGIMVARGDMGVEIPLEDVPVMQKMIIKKACEAGKIVITATQMLDSMMKHPRPTRAEVNDVANAIYDFTDAIMLSGETAQGDYPVEAVTAMDRIAKKVEASIDYAERFNKAYSQCLKVRNITSAVSHSACTTANDLNASIISTMTLSGRAVKEVSKYRPATPILGCSPVERTCRQLNLIWGTTPMQIDFEQKSMSAGFDALADKALKLGYANSGDLMVFTGGTPLGTTGSTNTIKVGIVGDVLLTGRAMTKASKFTSHTNICTSAADAKLHFKSGDIFVTSNPDKGLIPYMMKAGAIIVGSADSKVDFTHAVDLARELKVPCILCDIDVATTIPDKLLVTIDSNKGTVNIERK